MAHTFSFVFRVPTSWFPKSLNGLWTVAWKTPRVFWFLLNCVINSLPHLFSLQLLNKHLRGFSVGSSTKWSLWIWAKCQYRLSQAKVMHYYYLCCPSRNPVATFSFFLLQSHDVFVGLDWYNYPLLCDAPVHTICVPGIYRDGLCSSENFVCFSCWHNYWSNLIGLKEPWPQDCLHSIDDDRTCWHHSMLLKMHVTFGGFDSAPPQKKNLLNGL